MRACLCSVWRKVRERVPIVLGSMTLLSIPILIGVVIFM